MATISQEVSRLLDQLSPADQQAVLEYTRSLTKSQPLARPFARTPLPPGTPGSAILRFRVSDEGGAVMEQALADREPEANKRYSMMIQWSDADQAYLVTVPELPGCVTHGATYEEAVRQGQDAIDSWIEANRAWGRPIPAPRTTATV